MTIETYPMEHFSLSEPKYASRWQPLLAGVGRLFDEACRQHDTDITLRVYRAAAAILPEIQNLIDVDIAETERVLENASHLHPDTPAVVELSDRYEGMFIMRKAVVGAAWAMDCRMFEMGLINDFGGRC
jgi:hypothetical protein